MNLIPLNKLAHPLRGDVETLPMWSLMNPFFIQPGENLLVSSEDVRCFLLRDGGTACLAEVLSIQ